MTLMYLAVLFAPAFAQDTGEGADTSDFDAMSADEWESAEAFVADLARDWGTTWTAEEGHEIVGGIVADADEEGIHYLATKRTTDDEATQLSIFKHYSDGSFERLLRVDNAGDAAWYVVGYDGAVDETGRGYVVYAETSAAYDPGECGEPFVSAADGADGALYKLPDNFAESWSVGPTEYDADQVDVDEARTRQDECNAGQGGEDTGDTGEEQP